MNLVLFYVWEDAKVWAHWNHSFGIYLSYLGPVSCVFSSLSLLRVHHWGWLHWLMAWWWASCFYPEFPQGSLSWGGCNVMARWLQHPLFTDLAGNIVHLHTQWFFIFFECQRLELSGKAALMLSGTSLWPPTKAFQGPLKCIKTRCWAALKEWSTLGFLLVCLFCFLSR